MRTDLVVVHEPGVSGASDLRERAKVLHVEELIADAGVESFDPSVLRRFARIDEVIDRPLQHRRRHVFRSVIDPQAIGISTNGGNFVERADNTATCEREIGIKSETFSTEAIFDREQARFPARHQLLLHEVEAPLFVEPRRRW